MARAVAAALLLGTAIITLGALVAVVVSKATHDRRARAHAAAVRVGASMTGRVVSTADVDALASLLAAAAAGDTRRQADLLEVYRRWARGGLLSPDRSPTDACPEQVRVLAAAVRDQVDDPDPVRRGLAVALGGFPVHSLPVTRLADALTDPDPDVRLVAADSLQRRGTRAAADTLIEGLTVAALPPPRLAERLGYPWALPACLAALAAADPAVPNGVDPVPWLTRSVALVGDPAAVPALLAWARSPDLERRLNAVRALGACARPGDQAAVAAVRSAANDHSPLVRAQAYHAVGRLGDVSDIPMLRRGLTDRGWHARGAAAEALLRFGGPGRAALSEATLLSDRYAVDRARETLAADALARLGSRS